MTTACGTIAVMRTSRERIEIWGQSARTTTIVVGFALHLFIYIYIMYNQLKLSFDSRKERLV